MSSLNTFHILANISTPLVVKVYNDGYLHFSKYGYGYNMSVLLGIGENMQFKISNPLRS